MTFNPGFDLEIPDPVPEDGVFVFPLCITQDQLLTILECVELGGLALGLGRQGPHKAPFWRAFAYIDDPQNACIEAVNGGVCPDETDCPPVPGSCNCPQLPDGVMLVDGNLVLELGCMAGDIIINNGCCCNCNCGQSGGGGVITAPDQLTGGNVQEPLSYSATKCDVATDVVPFFITQVEEWLETVDLAITNGAEGTDAVLGAAVDVIDPTDLAPNTIETLAEIAATALDATLNAFDDSDMVLRTQENWWARVPSGARFTEFTRADALNLGRSLPVLWGNVALGQGSSPRLVGEALGRIVDLGKLSRRVQLARGNADEALCAYLASVHGESYDSPVGLLPTPPIVLTNDYWLSEPQIVQQTLVIPGGNDPVNSGISSVLDNLDGYPGIVGFFVYGTFQSGSSAGGASFQIRDTSVASYAGNYVIGDGTTLDGTVQEFAVFVGPAGLEALWDAQAFTQLGDVQSSALQEASPSITFGPYNNWPASSLTLDFEVRYLIDSAVQPPA